MQPQGEGSAGDHPGRDRVTRVRALIARLLDRVGDLVKYTAGRLTDD